MLAIANACQVKDARSLPITGKRCGPGQTDGMKEYSQPTVEAVGTIGKQPTCNDLGLSKKGSGKWRQHAPAPLQGPEYICWDVRSAYQQLRLRGDDLNAGH
jgi:hypothetical protein